MNGEWLNKIYPNFQATENYVAKGVCKCWLTPITYRSSPRHFRFSMAIFSNQAASFSSFTSLME